jgi:hypothetical protein
MPITRNGKPVYFAFTGDTARTNDPDVPGICSVCGALVPGINVNMMTEEGVVNPMTLHNDWHRNKGDLPPTSGLDGA